MHKCIWSHLIKLFLMQFFLPFVPVWWSSFDRAHFDEFVCVSIKIGMHSFGFCIQWNMLRWNYKPSNGLLWNLFKRVKKIYCRQSKMLAPIFNVNICGKWQTFHFSLAAFCLCSMCKSMAYHWAESECGFLKGIWSGDY